MIPTSALLLATTNGTHGRHSGYTALADHIPGATRIERVRKPQEDGLRRIACKVLRQGALTDWYRWGSANMEWAALRHVWSGFDGLIHVMWADCDLGFLDMLPRRRRTPLCATFHCCPDTLKTDIRFPFRLRSLDGIILMSQSQREYFETSGVRPERIHVILHGVDTKFFRPGPPKAFEGFTVLSVGGTRRNFSLLLAVAEAVRGDPNILFRVIGPATTGDLFSSLPNVEFRTQLTEEQLRCAYQDASCLLMTAQNATANNAVLEAMACGLPIISESVGGIPEYVTDDCAILTPPNSVRAIVNALESVKASKLLRTAMATASLRRAEELDWSRVAVKTCAIYREIISQRRTLSRG